MNKKYEFTGETRMVNGITLNRIISVRAFDGVTVGQLGGLLQSEDNLSHDGNCWVGVCSSVFENARVSDGAWATGASKMYGNAKLMDKGQIMDSAVMKDDSQVRENAQARGDTVLGGNMVLKGNEIIESQDGTARMTNQSTVSASVQRGCHKA